jgi:hypothetical protein
MGVGVAGMAWFRVQKLRRWRTGSETSPVQAARAGGLPPSKSGICADSARVCFHVCETTVLQSNGRVSACSGHATAGGGGDRPRYFQPLTRPFGFCLGDSFSG